MFLVCWQPVFSLRVTGTSNKDKRCKSCNGADHPNHQDATVSSEKLKLLKISSLKTEQEQAVVGVLNTDV